MYKAGRGTDEEHGLEPTAWAHTQARLLPSLCATFSHLQNKSDNCNTYFTELLGLNELIHIKHLVTDTQ